MDLLTIYSHSILSLLWCDSNIALTTRNAYLWLTLCSWKPV